MKVVQIKGGNGSGKSTICRQLLELNGVGVKHVAPLKWRDNDKRKVFGTILKNVGWIFVGGYSLDAMMGGTDCYPSTVNLIKKAIELSVEFALADNNIVGIVFEGMMISTIKSTFYQYLLQLELSFGIEPLFVILQTTPNGCMTRLARRPSVRKKKLPKFENIASKSTMVVTHALTYNQKYVRWIDVEHTAEGDMLRRFAEEVGDEWLLENL